MHPHQIQSKFPSVTLDRQARLIDLTAVFAKMAVLKLSQTRRRGLLSGQSIGSLKVGLPHSVEGPQIPDSVCFAAVLGMKAIAGR